VARSRALSNRTKQEPIRVWDRALGREIEEQVYGEGGVRFMYGNPVGRGLGVALFARRWFSQLYGWLQSTRWSGRKVAPFIERYAIPMAEYEPGPFPTFNDFFVRRFRAEARPWASEADQMPAFAEARYFAWAAITDAQTFPVKGRDLSSTALLGNAELARDFTGGPLLLARLCPVDYHRFHYPDDGRTLETYRARGAFHSVNPIALATKSDVLATNERQVTLLETRNFGKLAYIEVGAMCVGKIIQSHTAPAFARGDEKGYFLFGGSTVIVLGQPGRWEPDPELLRKTEERRETLVRLGQPVARALHGDGAPRQ
jgi:phosphatidylserine decarboxylase